MRKYSLPSFYAEFYGLKFVRHFRRLHNLNNNKVRRQFTVKNPKQLYLKVHQNSGYHACTIHVYDHGSIDNLNGNDRDNMQYDRTFFDFDVESPEVKKLKKDLTKLRGHGPHYKKDLQAELKQQLQDLIINNRIIEPAINEAKEFSKQFKESFGTVPALFFSGCKGAHAYTFFNYSKFYNIEAAISWFAENLEETYPTLDLTVLADATSRVSRVPYSKHQLTDLTVAPFTIEDSYNDIMEKSLNPTVEPFNQLEHSSNFNEHLIKIDKILENNREIHEAKRGEELRLNPPQIGDYNNIDHRIFFKKILGEPESEYLDKEYVMYKCPFKDHNDDIPSFRVHKTGGYYCYGCGRKGNYKQFLKDYKKLK